MTIQTELETVRHASPDGKLRAEEVVKYARSHKSSALHARFDWNIDRAAMEHWLKTARDIIRVTVTITPANVAGPAVVVPNYTSLSTQRSPEGGYEPTTVVLRSAPKRRQLIQDTLARLESIAEVGFLDEFIPVRNAIARVRASYPKEKEETSKVA